MGTNSEDLRETLRRLQEQVDDIETARQAGYKEGLAEGRKEAVELIREPLMRLSEVLESILTGTHRAPLTLSVDKLDLPTAPRNRLLAEKITILHLLLWLSDEALEEIPQIGQVSISKINHAVLKAGYERGKDKPPIEVEALPREAPLKQLTLSNLVMTRLKDYGCQTLRDVLELGDDEIGRVFSDSLLAREMIEFRLAQAGYNYQSS